MRYILDEQGQRFSSLWKATETHGVSYGGPLQKRLEKNGVCRSGGHTFYLYDDNRPRQQQPTANVVIQKDPTMERLRQRYSDSEIEAIARGEGIERRVIAFPEIHLTGKHHKFIVISDTHIGSVYSPYEWHDIVSDYANESGAEAVLHCGDLVEGMKIQRIGTQIYELSDIGYEAQKSRAMELLSMYDIPIYIISGNHDFYYQEYAGANIIKSLSDSLENVTYIGHDSADIDIDGATIRLFHAGTAPTPTPFPIVSKNYARRLQVGVNQIYLLPVTFTNSVISLSVTFMPFLLLVCKCKLTLCEGKS